GDGARRLARRHRPGARTRHPRPSRHARRDRGADHPGADDRRLPPRAPGSARRMSRRRLWTLVRREVRATFRDPFTVSILIAVPLVALLAFSSVISTEVHNLGLAVLDADQSPESRRLVADIAASGWFTLRPVASQAEIDRGLRGGDVGVALVIPPAFSRALHASCRRAAPRPR